MSRTYPKQWDEIARRIKEKAGWRCERCGHPHDPPAGYTLTVAHLDPSYGHQRWNLAALCQRCHLLLEHRFAFRQGYLFDHNDWFLRHLRGWMQWRENRRACRVTVMLCVNDPANGMHTGRLHSIEFMTAADSLLLHLYCVWANESRYPTCRLVEHIKEGPRGPRRFRRLRVGRREFRILSFGFHVGNWCWDAVTMWPAEAARLVNHLRSLDKFEVETAPTELFERWRAADRFRPCDLLFGQEIRAAEPQPLEVPG